MDAARYETHFVDYHASRHWRRCLGRAVHLLFYLGDETMNDSNAAPTLLEALKMALEAPDDDRSWEDYAIAAIKAADPMWEDPLVN